MTTLKQKLVCPYCKGKQEFAARDYFTAPYAGLTEEVMCDHCDQKFKATILKDGNVTTYSNLRSDLVV